MKRQARRMTPIFSRPSASNTLATMPFVEPALAYIAFGRILIDEGVGQHHRADLQAAVERAVLGQRLHHIGAEPADRAFLDGDQHFVLAREPQHQIGVERLGEARVRDGGRKPERASSSAAFRHSASRVPNESSATLCLRARCGPCRSRAARRTPASRRRRLRRADSAARDGRSSIATCVATMCTSSASSAAAMITKPGRQPR